MNTLNMKIGENLGNVLLEIAQEHIYSGSPEKAINTYIDSLFGFTKEYVLMVLKNNAVLVVNDDEMNLTDDINIIQNNKNNIYDWNNIIENKLNNLHNILKNRKNIMDEFALVSYKAIDNFSLVEFMMANPNNKDISNIAARLIADLPFADVYGSGENVWAKLENHIQNDNATKNEKILYCLVEYVKNIRILHKEYMNFANMYKFLEDNDMITHVPFIEETMEQIIFILDKFADPNTGYYHPMCNVEIYQYKEDIIDDLLKTKYGNEYLKYGIIKKNISDGYDAGWLAPNGEFYGANGAISSMLHCNIAEQIYKGNNDYSAKMRNDEEFKDYKVDYWLETKGWIKIHYDEIYGAFYGIDKNDEDFPYCPTQEQLIEISKYVKKFYKGVFYPQCKLLRNVEPVSISKIMQMDDIMLHSYFCKF